MDVGVGVCMLSESGAFELVFVVVFNFGLCSRGNADHQFDQGCPGSAVISYVIYSRSCLIARNRVSHTFMYFLLARPVILQGYSFHGHGGSKMRALLQDVQSNKLPVDHVHG